MAFAHVVLAFPLGSPHPICTPSLPIDHSISTEVQPVVGGNNWTEGIVHEATLFALYADVVGVLYT